MHLLSTFLLRPCTTPRLNTTAMLCKTVLLTLGWRPFSYKRLTCGFWAGEYRWVSQANSELLYKTPSGPGVGGTASLTYPISQRVASLTNPVNRRVASLTYPISWRVASLTNPISRRVASPTYPISRRVASPTYPIRRSVASLTQPISRRVASLTQPIRRHLVLLPSAF